MNANMYLNPNPNMMYFETRDNVPYIIPRKFIDKYKSNFNVYENGKIPMTSNQINFIFYSVDDFTLDEFVQSIPIIFQLSSKELDLKVMEKIQFLIKDIEGFSEIKIMEYIKYYNIISTSISEKSTFEDLKKILLDYHSTNWDLNFKFILKKFFKLSREENKEYFLTITNMTESIIDYLTDYNNKENVKYYFQFEDIVVHLLNNLKKLEYEKIAHYIFSYSNFSTIKYFLENNKFGNNYCESFIGYGSSKKAFAIHYATKRSMEDFIIYLIEKGVDINERDNKEDLPLRYILEFAPPSLLKYIFNKNPTEILDPTFGKLYFSLQNNKNPEMIQFIKDNNINTRTSFKVFENLIKE